MNIPSKASKTRDSFAPPYSMSIIKDVAFVRHPLVFAKLCRFVERSKTRGIYFSNGATRVTRYRIYLFTFIRYFYLSLFVSIYRNFPDNRMNDKKFANIPDNATCSFRRFS